MTKVKEVRRRTRHYLRNANGIRVGDRFVYVSKRNVEYDAEIIQITDHLLIMSLVVDQDTISNKFGCPRAYNYSIRKSDVGVTEKLYLYA